MVNRYLKNHLALTYEKYENVDDENCRYFLTFQAWLSGFLNFMVHCGVFLYKNPQKTSSNYQVLVWNPSWSLICSVCHQAKFYKVYINVCEDRKYKYI